LPSRVAVPDKETGQVPPFGIAPIPIALQVSRVASNVPDAVPLTATFPQHFALQFPDALVSETLVTDH